MHIFTVRQNMPLLCLVLDVTVGNTDQFSKFTVTFDTKFDALRTLR